MVSVAGEESAKLKKLVADIGFDMLMLQDILTKKTLRSVEKRVVEQYLQERFETIKRRRCTVLRINR